MKRAALGVLVLCLLGGLGSRVEAQTADAVSPVYRDTRYSFDERAVDLVSRMTLEEKAPQLATTNAPAIPRLGVQEYSYWNEAQHGVFLLFGDYHDRPIGVRATSFPTNLSASLTWDPDLMRRQMEAVSDEARGFLDPSLFGTGTNNLGPSAGAYGSLFFFNPTVNLNRDPRWGRTDEAFGEDPFLVGAMGSAYVNGFQGQTAEGAPQGKYLKAIATAKHFALNNVETRRTAISSDADEGTIRDYYTPQFRRLIEESHVAGLMNAYNAVNGTPAVANNFLLNVLARRTWGFDGYVTSDCAAVATTYRRKDVSVNLPSGLEFAGHDWAPPGWTTDHAGERARWTNPATGTQISGQAGGQSYALRAGTDVNCAGDNGQAGHPAILDAVRPVFGQENGIAYIREAVAAGVLGEDVIDRALVRVFTLRMRTGEFDPVGEQPYTKITKDAIESPAHRQLAQDVGAQSLVLFKNDRPRGSASPLLPADPAKLHKVVVLGDQADKVFLGGYSGAPSEQISVRQGISDALPGAQVIYDSGQSSTTSTSPASFKPDTEAAIRDADLVVIMVGTDAKSNSEGSDRASIAMPGNYNSLVDKAASLGNPKIALLVQAGGVVNLESVKDRVAAILYSGPNGQRQGRAAADVLFGNVNPSGHLSFTWYQDDSQLPPIDDYDIMPSQTSGLGRTYQYFTGTPTYPFGYGLSYTRFRYSNVRVDPRPGPVSRQNTTPLSVDAGGAVRISFRVRNVGQRAGATVAQIYASSPATDRVEAPIKRLVGFRKTQVLAPGQTQSITIAVPIASTLRLFDAHLHRETVDPGRWRFELASSSRDLVRSLPVRITGRIPETVAHVTVQPAKVVLHPGDTVDLLGKNPWLQGLAPADLANPGDDVVTAVRRDDTFVDLRRAAVEFRSNRPDIARVDKTGKVLAVGTGVATISVTVDGVTGTTAFGVK